MTSFLEYEEEKITDSGFEFFINVSLDSNKGLFRRYHVGNNPVNDMDPLGLYGTTDCSYYQKMCKENGGVYYCTIVPFFCENWPDRTAPKFSECVRQCLQDFDKKFCHDPCNKQDSYTCKFADSHAYCFTACASNSNETPNWLK